MSEDDVYQAYERFIQRAGRASYTARQNAYTALQNIYGPAWVSAHATPIKNRLDEIERSVTGRDCREDWRAV